MKFIHLFRCNISYVASEQMWRIMKMIIVIMTVFLLQVSASTSAQQLTIKDDNITLQKVFAQIRKQTGFTVLVKYSLIKEASPISLNLKKVPLEEALKQILEGSKLNYTIKDKGIVITKIEEPSFLERIIDRFNRIDIRGRIVSSDGYPISGATVTVKGTKQTNVTDQNGLFSFNGVNENAILQITYIGYKTKEVSAKSSLGNILLEESDNPLDEVQVIAYGATSRRLSTGNITTVTAKDIEKQPVNNPILALQGRVPGLVVNQSNGIPGSGITVRIQGQNSIAKGNDPFYVIDGVPYLAQLPPNLAGTLLGNSGYLGSSQNTFGQQPGNPLSFINPGDIESISILKDADATAIYGSRAANGAILITTKKGKAGKTTVILQAQQGSGKVTRRLPLLNTKQYLAMRREAMINDGQAIPTSTTTPSSLNYDFTVWDTVSNTDWQKELIGGVANYSDVQGAVSGGSGQTTFKISGGYHRESTVFPGDFADVKGSVGFNLSHKTLNNKFWMQATGSYLNDNNQLPGVDLTSTVMQMAPNAPTLFRPDGTLNWARIETNALTKDSVSTWRNPLAYMSNTYQSIVSNLVSNLQVGYRLISGLELTTNLGYNTLTNNDMQLNPVVAFAPELRPTRTRTAAYGYSNTKSWLIEPQLNYNRPLGHGKLEVLAGSTFLKNFMSVLQLSGSGYFSDQVMTDPKSATTLTVSNTLDAEYNYAALFGRVNYNYADKYIVNLTGRRDGSSRFGSENLFHNFGAVGAAWLFSNEPFFNKLLRIVSFGKLRASYGTTGNDQIGDYSFMNLYTSVTSPSLYQSTRGLAPNGHTDPLLQWESTTKLQAALEMGLLKDRVFLNINYYKNRSSNQLIAYNLPNFTGFANVSRNFPATLENRGWEISVSTDNIITKFKWSSNINFTVPKNELIAFPNLSNSSYASQLVIGKPAGIVRFYEAAGSVDPTTGLYQFLTPDGKPTAATPSVRNYIFYNAPTFYGGVSNSVSYRGVTLDFLFQFTKQIAKDYFIGNRPGFFASDASTTATGNQPSWVLDRWQKIGDVARIQKFTTGLTSNALGYLNYMQSSNGSYSDASFVRLKNVSISWQMPTAVLQAVKLTTAQLFAHGQNLLTITSFKALDPESRATSSSGLVLPPLRVITFGIKVGL